MFVMDDTPTPAFATPAEAAAYALGVDDTYSLLKNATRPVNVQAMAEALVSAAAAQGLVLTIEQRPLKPLAQGHHETVVSLRPADPNGNRRARPA